MFASGKFSEQGFSCCFVWVCVCLPVWFQRISSTSSQNQGAGVSTPFGMLAPKHLYPQFVYPQRLEARKAVRKLKEHPVPAFTLNMKPRIVRWGPQRGPSASLRFQDCPPHWCQITTESPSCHLCVWLRSCCLRFRGSLDPLFRFNWFARVTHRIQEETSLLTRLLVYYRRIWDFPGGPGVRLWAPIA